MQNNSLHKRTLDTKILGLVSGEKNLDLEHAILGLAVYTSCKGKVCKYNLFTHMELFVSLYGLYFDNNSTFLSLESFQAIHLPGN